MSMRERLSAKQAEFLEALSRGGTVPERFDAERVRIARESLASKRMRSVARSWPALTAMLGETFATRFHEFAATTPLPREGGPLADGRAFARRLAEQGAFAEFADSDSARLEILAVDLRYRGTREGLIRRRGPYIRAAFLPKSRRVVLAMRFPFVGERWWGFVLKRW